MSAASDPRTKLLEVLAHETARIHNSVKCGMPLSLPAARMLETLARILKTLEPAKPETPPVKRDVPSGDALLEALDGMGNSA